MHGHTNTKLSTRVLREKWKVTKKNVEFCGALNFATLKYRHTNAASP